MKIFQHTSRERGLWRGWLKNGQSVEISTMRHGWGFGAGVHVHSNDMDMGDRMLFVKLWRLTIVLPLGIIRREIFIDSEPQWSAYASNEFGLTFHWGQRRKSFDWPWSLHTLAYEKKMPDGTWHDVLHFADKPYSEQHSYRYVLKSGVVQERIATVSRRRHVICWRAFKALRWPRWIRESIEIEFSDEVGERSGSWKGGTIGCGYDLREGETMLDALRRMERERIFS